MDEDLPPSPAAERDALIAEIKAAFDGVTREGGVSWSESEALDDAFGGTEAFAAARESDKDVSWAELVDALDWQPVDFYGGWPFLDTIGFRYYVAPAMIRCLRGDCREAIEYHLERELTAQDSPGGAGQWPELTDRQNKCIRAFVRHMVARHEPTPDLDAYAPWGWGRTLKSHRIEGAEE